MSKPKPSKDIAVRVIAPEKGFLIITAISTAAQEWLKKEAKTFGQAIPSTDRPEELTLFVYPNFPNLVEVVNYLESGGKEQDTN
jgi:hypothetical protein